MEPKGPTGKLYTHAQQQSSSAGQRAPPWVGAAVARRYESAQCVKGPPAPQACAPPKAGPPALPPGGQSAASGAIGGPLPFGARPICTAGGNSARTESARGVAGAVRGGY